MSWAPCWSWASCVMPHAVLISAGLRRPCLLALLAWQELFKARRLRSRPFLLGGEVSGEVAGLGRRAIHRQHCSKCAPHSQHRTPATSGCGTAVVNPNNRKCPVLDADQCCNVHAVHQRDLPGEQLPQHIQHRWQGMCFSRIVLQLVLQARWGLGTKVALWLCTCMHDQEPRCRCCSFHTATRSFTEGQFGCFNCRLLRGDE